MSFRCAASLCETTRQLLKRAAPTARRFRTGEVPPLAGGYTDRPDTAHGIVATLVPGSTVALVPAQAAAEGPSNWLGACGKTQIAVIIAESLWRSGAKVLGRGPVPRTRRCRPAYPLAPPAPLLAPAGPSARNGNGINAPSLPSQQQQCSIVAAMPGVRDRGGAGPRRAAASSSAIGALLPAKPTAAARRRRSFRVGRPRNPRVRSAIASGCSSRAKWPASCERRGRSAAHPHLPPQLARWLPDVSPEGQPVRYVPKTYFAAMAAGFHSVATGVAGPVTVTGRAWTTQTGSPSRRCRSSTHSTSTG